MFDKMWPMATSQEWEQDRAIELKILELHRPKTKSGRYELKLIPTIPKAMEEEQELKFQISFWQAEKAAVEATIKDADKDEKKVLKLILEDVKAQVKACRACLESAKKTMKLARERQARIDTLRNSVKRTVPTGQQHRTVPVSSGDRVMHPSSSSGYENFLANKKLVTGVIPPGVKVMSKLMRGNGEDGLQVATVGEFDYYYKEAGHAGSVQEAEWIVKRNKYEDLLSTGVCRTEEVLAIVS